VPRDANYFELCTLGAGSLICAANLLTLTEI
jgi:hypothetical protein